MDNANPPTPDALLSELLPRFGLVGVRAIRAWPCYTDGVRRGIHRLVAQFTCGEQDYFLKARTVEHRGPKSLHETQYIQKEFQRLGVAVPALHPTPSGETLVAGPDPRDEASEHYEVLRYLLGPGFYDVPAVYYEVQHAVPNRHPAIDEGLCRQIGAALSAFHAAGRQPTIRSLAPDERHLAPHHVDTHLLNKGYYIGDFINRSRRRLAELHTRLQKLPHISPAEQRALAEMFHRIDSRSRRGALSWGIIHGNFCFDNVIAADDALFIIDLDETGLGALADDLGEFITDIGPDPPQRARAFLTGYLQHGGQLNDADRTSIVDGLVVQQLLTADDDREIAVQDLFDQYWSLF